MSTDAYTTLLVQIAVRTREMRAAQKRYWMRQTTVNYVARFYAERAVDALLEEAAEMERRLPPTEGGGE